MASADKVNILVVDDLPDKRLALEAILEPLGENVVTAGSGREALRKLLEADFAVILLDVYMPEMDGFETAGLIRQRKRSRDTPIIFVTSFQDEMRAVQGYSMGAVDYILAPVVPEVLRAKVGVFVDLFRKNEQVRRQAEQEVALAREQAARAAAEEATRRSQFLAEASTVLTSSLDHAATVRSLTRLAVPQLADVAAVTLVGEPGQPWRSELAWVPSPAGPVHTLSLEAPEGPDDEVRAAVERVLRTGRPEVLEGLAVPYPPKGAAGAAGGAAGLLRRALLLPLLARGRTLGVLSLAMGESGRRFGRDDVALAEDLAGRAAIAIDNARLYRDIREADRRKNEFLAMLAHELRNPLAPIRNAAQVLRLLGLENPTLDWARDVLDRQVGQMVRIVDDLLDVSRITRGKIQLRTEPVDVAAVVARAVETSRPLIDARRHGLSVALPPEPLRAEADPARLAQVLANLLNNAAKYTEEGGQIWLDVAREAGEVVFRVRDTGIGIPREMLASVFELFTQADRSLDRSQGGLGIGLTLVKSLVEMHGGSVRASSEGPGKGSEFVVRLPALPADPPPPSANGSREVAGAGARRRVLVVDDNVDGADSLAILLRAARHEVAVSHDGAAALREAEAFRPEVVLLDIGLPGMSGYEVARRLRQLPGLEGVLLVALTGYGQDEDRQRSRDAGIDHHLVKPADPQALQQLLGDPTLLAPRA
jgi:signal transduction histidine kinase/DNA-binding response OmpR family regulator